MNISNILPKSKHIYYQRENIYTLYTIKCTVKWHHKVKSCYLSCAKPIPNPGLNLRCWSLSSNYRRHWKIISKFISTRIAFFEISSELANTRLCWEWYNAAVIEPRNIFYIISPHDSTLLNHTMYVAVKFCMVFTMPYHNEPRGNLPMLIFVLGPCCCFIRLPRCVLNVCQWLVSTIIPDSKVHGANTGPIWGRQDPNGPHVGPMNFAIWDGCLNQRPISSA